MVQAPHRSELWEPARRLCEPGLERWVDSPAPPPPPPGTGPPRPGPDGEGRRGEGARTRAAGSEEGPGCRCGAHPRARGGRPPLSRQDLVSPGDLRPNPPPKVAGDLPHLPPVPTFSGRALSGPPPARSAEALPAPASPDQVLGRLLLTFQLSRSVRRRASGQPLRSVPGRHLASAEVALGSVSNLPGGFLFLFPFFNAKRVFTCMPRSLAQNLNLQHGALALPASRGWARELERPGPERCGPGTRAGMPSGWRLPMAEKTNRRWEAGTRPGPRQQGAPKMLRPPPWA